MNTQSIFSPLNLFLSTRILSGYADKSGGPDTGGPASDICSATGPDIIRIRPVQGSTPNPPNPLSSIQFQAPPARPPSRGRNSQREQQPKIEFFNFLILNSYFENLKDIPEECIHGFRIGFDRNDDGNSRLETLFNNAPFLSENPFVFLKKTRTALAPALFCSNEGFLIEMEHF